MLSRVILDHVISEANLAPSVHNTQPARWHISNDGSILIAADLSRQLLVGDASARDMGLSCGAAIEGTVLALSKAGFGIKTVENLWELDDQQSLPGHRIAGQLFIKADSAALPLAADVDNRFTWRSYFKSAPLRSLKALQAFADGSDDVTLATTSADKEFLARLNDLSSLTFFRDWSYRKELVSWMRLAKSHPDYLTDGLNLEALNMGVLEGSAAKIILDTVLFEAMDKVGLGGNLISEKSKTLSANAIAMFHRPVEESPVDTGRAFYRFWLRASALGFAAWPMAVIADNAESADACCRHFGIPDGRRLINVLRFGHAGARQPRRARLPIKQLLV